MQKTNKTTQKPKKTKGNFEFGSSSRPVNLPLSIVTDSLPAGDYFKGVLHFHQSLEIGVCRKGSGTFTIEDRSIRFAPGDTIVIGPGLRHTALSDKGTESRWTWVFIDPLPLLASHVEDVDILHCSPYSLTSSAVMHMSAASHPLISLLLDELVREFADEGSRDALRALLVLLLTHLRRLTRRQASGSTAGTAFSGLERIVPALKLINARFGDRLTVDEMASACCMGERTFCIAFKQAVHETPHDYLTRLRVAQSCVMLAGSQESISRIALRCGFESLSSLNRNFRAEMGTTPIAYRNKEMARR